MKRRDFFNSASAATVLGALLPASRAGAAPAAQVGRAHDTPSGFLFNVREFGAAGDGAHKDSNAIARAIEACSKAGGGTVWFPAGRYLTGAVNLESRVTLYLEAGAVILGSEDPADYPLRKDPWEPETQEYSSLIYGEGLEDVALRGQGTIDGQGRIWWEALWTSIRKRSSSGVRVTPEKNPEDVESAKARLRYGRPRLVRLVECKRVTLEGLRLTNSGMWTVNPVFCEDVNLRGLSIVNPVPSANTDGIDPESSRNVHISDCLIDVGDDCIAIKSGKDEVGRKKGRPCENITITNLTTINGHAGVAIGSEMSGGVRNVAIANCVFQGTQRGLRIKSQRGRGGVVERVVAENIAMQEVPEAIVLTMFYSGRRGLETAEPVTEGTPRFRDIQFSNIIARGSKTAGEITGLREMPISGVTLRGIRIEAQRGFSCTNAADITWRDTRIECREGAPLSADHVEGLELDGFNAVKPPAGGAVAELATTKKVFVHGCTAASGTPAFLELRDTPRSEVVFAGNNFGATGEIAGG